MNSFPPALQDPPHPPGREEAPNPAPKLMDCRPTKPAEFVMETTELVVLFSGKSQPIKIPCASRNDNPEKKKKATVGKKAFIDNTLAHNSNFGRDRYPYLAPLKMQILNAHLGDQGTGRPTIEKKFTTWNSSPVGTRIPPRKRESKPAGRSDEDGRGKV